MNGRERRAPIAGALLAVGLSGCLQRNPDFVGATGEATGDDTGSPAAGVTTTGGPMPDPTSSSPADGDEPTSTTRDGSLACAPTLDSLRISVFSEGCTADGCHAGQLPAAALDLETVDLGEDLLDVASTTCPSWSRVKASAPEQSLLYAKVAGIATCDVDRPVAHDPLTPDHLECLRSWIETIQDCDRCGSIACVDLQSDPSHCGACDVECSAELECVGGACSCPGGGIVCGDTCVQPESDPLHCGGCDNDCQGNPCIEGTCACVGLTFCGGCVDTQTNADHCGGCDMPCGFGRTCQGGACGCSPTPVSLSADVQPIFTESCVHNACHGGNNPQENLRLEAGSSWANLVDVPAVQCADGRARVAPGNPDTSYLMHKLLGVQICSGEQMPPSGGPIGDGELPPGELDLIAAWICQGALDN